MPSLNAGALDRTFRGKLQAKVLEDRKDRCYEIYDETGALVARTWLSHGWKGSDAIDVSMLAKIRRQLKVNSVQDVVRLVACSLDRDSYLEIAAS